MKAIKKLQKVIDEYENFGDSTSISVSLGALREVMKEIAKKDLKINELQAWIDNELDRL